MSGVIIDFATISRGYEERSAEQLVNVMYCSVGLGCGQCRAHRAGTQSKN